MPILRTALLANADRGPDAYADAGNNIGWAELR